MCLPLFQRLKRALCLTTHEQGPEAPAEATDADQSPIHDTPLCPTCSALDFQRILYDGVPRQHAIPLGPLPSILANTTSCSFCRLVGTVLRRSWALDGQGAGVDISEVTCALFAEECGCLQDPAPATRELCHRLYVLTSDRPQEIYAAMVAAQTGLLLHIQLLEEDAPQVARQAELHGRRVPGTLSMDLVKRWIGLCEKDHGDVCESVWWRGGDTALPQSIRVLDVVDMVLRPAPPDCRFVALSYLWGGVGEEYWTSTANAGQRAAAGGVDMSVLPRTITDSILLVHLLGERFLWVDALCIIQDDPEDRTTQIHTMELIYGGALFTIFAAGGTNAHAPLPGLRPGTRQIRQHIESIQGLHLAVPLPDLRETLARSTWDTRGWTYQELMLSRRRLFLTGAQAYFECGQEVWCEDVRAEAPRAPRSHHPLRHTGGGGFTYLRPPPRWLKAEYIAGYMAAVARYTQRRLTTDADAVDALTALTNALAKGFALEGGDPRRAFRFGMPVPDLARALLWQPAVDAPHARRGAPRWPSWAWAGWRGAVRYASDRQFVDVHSAGDVPRPVESLVHAWFVVEGGGRLGPLGVRAIERVVACPEDEDEAGLVRYVPARERVDLRAVETSVPGALVFNTSRARFGVARVEAEEAAGAYYASFAVLAGGELGSARVGRVILPFSTDVSRPLEFIVLSRSNGTPGVYDGDEEGERFSGRLLYVMAVRKMHGSSVVERVGVGIIFEEAWLAADAKNRLVVLG